MLISLLLVLSIDPTVEELFHLYNTVRVENKKNIVGLSPELCKVAQNYAKLIENSPIKHDADGKVSDRLNRAGYKWSNCGENIARVPFFYTEKQIVDYFMGSSSHKENILGNYKEIGIGYSFTTYVVVFATPRK